MNEVNGVRPSARTRRVVCAPLAVISGCSCGKVTGAQDITYAAQGQTAEQRKRDRHDRHVWAVQQIGCNPSRQVAQASPAPPPAVTTSPMRGAARGAVDGAIGGDPGAGAVVGGATGALIGGIRRREQPQHQAADQQQYLRRSAERFDCSAASRVRPPDEDVPARERLHGELAVDENQNSERRADTNFSTTRRKTG